MEHVVYVADKIREIKDEIRELGHDGCSYSFMYKTVNPKVEALREYAEEHEVPFMFDLEDVIYDIREELSEYYNDESSSYYDEGDSSW